MVSFKFVYQRILVMLGSGISNSSPWHISCYIDTCQCIPPSLISSGVENIGCVNADNSLFYLVLKLYNVYQAHDRCSLKNLDSYRIFSCICDIV